MPPSIRLSTLRTSRSPRPCSASTSACRCTPVRSADSATPDTPGSSGGGVARGATQGPYDFPTQGFKTGLVRGGPRPHRDVRRITQLREDLAAADFPDPAPEPVAPDGRVTIARHDHRESRTADRGRPGEQIQVIRSAALPLCHDCAKFSSARQAGRLGQPFRCHPPWCLDPVRTVRLLRPFLRRRLSVSRPHRVAMRARNPCLLIRFLFRGRYVGFTSLPLAKRQSIPDFGKPGNLARGASSGKFRGG